jgi:hypothetical protein
MSNNALDTEPMDQLMNIYEVAHLLHLHQASVRLWQKTGTLEAGRIGPRGSFRFKKETVLKFIDKSTDFPDETRSSGGRID